jgi:hypothetical protein
VTSPGTIIYRLSLVVMVASAAVIALWLAALKDYSYAVLAAPASFVGMASWAVAGIVGWRAWFILPLPFYAAPFLPWAEWMHG